MALDAAAAAAAARAPRLCKGGIPGKRASPAKQRRRSVESGQAGVGDSLRARRRVRVDAPDHGRRRLLDVGTSVLLDVGIVGLLDLVTCLYL